MANARGLGPFVDELFGSPPSDPGGGAAIQGGLYYTVLSKIGHQTDPRRLPQRAALASMEGVLMPSWIGPWEIGILVIVLLVVFGPKRLPELGSSLGKAITGFRKGLKESEQELRKSLADESTVAEAKKVAEDAKAPEEEKVG